MEDSPAGVCLPCPALKSLLDRVGVTFCFNSSQNRYQILDAKLGRKMREIKRSVSQKSSFKSINSIIMKFPRFKEGLKEMKGVFNLFGESLLLVNEELLSQNFEEKLSNLTRSLSASFLPIPLPYTDEDYDGTIDREEFKKCLQKLHLNVKEEDIDDLFYSCDIDENEGIQLKEFIVLLCLIYFLMDDSSTSSDAASNFLPPELEATFRAIVEAFLFLDKNGDGKLNNKDVVNSLNDASPWEKSPSHVNRTRFEELDRDRKGKVSFRQFLFAFINWVGIESDNEDIEIET